MPFGIGFDSVIQAEIDRLLSLSEEELVAIFDRPRQPPRQMRHVHARTSFSACRYSKAELLMFARYMKLYRTNLGKHELAMTVLDGLLVLKK